MKINKLVMMEMTINTMECLEFFMGYNNNSSCSIRSSKNTAQAHPVHAFTQKKASTAHTRENKDGSQDQWLLVEDRFFTISKCILTSVRKSILQK